MKPPTVKSCVFAAAFLSFAALSAGATDLIVYKGSPQVLNANATYDRVTLHDDLTFDGKGTSWIYLVAKSGLSIGPDEGDDATLTFRGYGRMTTSPVSTVIGANGGVGRVIVEADPARTDMLDVYYMGQFAVSEKAAAGDKEYIDVMEVRTNAAAYGGLGITNFNATPIRFVFNGGQLRPLNWDRVQFNVPAANNKIILEGINGNPIWLPTRDQRYRFDKAGDKGVIETRGDCTLKFQGYWCSNAKANPRRDYIKFYKGNNVWNHTGDTVLYDTGILHLQVDNGFPHGPNTGILRTDNTLNNYGTDQCPVIDFGGKSTELNGLDLTGGYAQNSASGTSTVSFGVSKPDATVKGSFLSMTGPVVLKQCNAEGTMSLKSVNGAKLQVLADKGVTDFVASTTRLPNTNALQSVTVNAALVAHTYVKATTTTVNNGGVMTLSAGCELGAATVKAGGALTVEANSMASTSLTVESGATVTVDGCTFEAASGTVSGSVVLENGGACRVGVPVASSAKTFDPATAAANVTYVKTGSGILSVTAAGGTFAGVLEVAAGTAKANGTTGVKSFGSLEVATDATFDGTAVTGGQVLSDITVDAANGGGAMKGVTFAATGTLRLKNVPYDLQLGDWYVPIDFASVSGTANLSGWKVVVSGETTQRVLEWVSGKMHIRAPDGFTLHYR